VFDSPAPDSAAVARFFSALAGVKVPVVIAPGNHDYYDPSGFWAAASLPKNVHVFERAELSCFPFDSLGVAVYGYAFCAETQDAVDIGRGVGMREEYVNILLAHADTTSPLSAYAPLSAGQLERCGYRYAALGHIHNPPQPRRYGETLVAYSGFFAGRGFDEIGAGHATLVEIDGRDVKLTEIESEAARFELVSLDCTGAENAEQVRTRVRDFLQEHPFAEDTALRILLQGEVGLGCHIDVAAVKRLGEGLALFEVVDATAPLLDAAALEKAPTLQGAFYRALLPRLQSENAEVRALAKEALRTGLAALAGREV
jgi:DNA repair exonuclease SbcCD nuclease subunit